MHEVCPDYYDEPEQMKIVDDCMACGEPICEGESYYDIDGTFICESCIKDFRKTAEVE